MPIKPAHLSHLQSFPVKLLRFRVIQNLLVDLAKLPQLSPHLPLLSSALISFAVTALVVAISTNLIEWIIC